MRAGDARETLSNITESIDILFLDGWKNLYLPILTQLLPQLPPGSIMLADNMNMFKKDLKRIHPAKAAGPRLVEVTALAARGLPCAS